MSRLLFCFLALLSITGQAHAGPHVERGKAYAPFYLKSSKTGEVIQGDYIEKEMVCRSPSETIKVTKRLLGDFDVLSTTGDASMAITEFRGKVGKRDVVVSIWVDHQVHRLMYVYINNDVALSCELF